MWTYNFLFLFSTLILIGVLTHFFAKVTHLLHSVLSTFIIILGFFSAGFLFYVFSEKFPSRMDRELVEKMGYVEYQVHILPKITPWSTETKLCFSNKDTNTKVEFMIDSKLDTSEIYEKIKEVQPHISEVLKYP